jgi:two-component system CheB/CheR fusion protein
MRIVGIGASAGGLVALEAFFAKVPEKAGLAYVVVQHLDPTQKAVLAELLQRVTSLPVAEVSGSMHVEPDKVYVIPPNTELSVVHGELRLSKPSEPRGLRLPINVLLSSIARDQGPLAVGVVMSGMGSDGTQGLLAIKAVGGLTLAQQPDSAQFDAMPKSAIEADSADIVALPEEMPARILSFIHQAASTDAPVTSRPEAPQAATPGNALQPIFELLQQRTRHDFSLYKPSTLHRRIERRMAIHGLLDMASYTEFLRQNTQEIDLLFKELLIGVTSFFRDPEAWLKLGIALAKLLSERGPQTELRAWVVGCSTGEEAYSLAMLFTEVVEQLAVKPACTLQIFASDLSGDAIATARGGRYPLTAGANLSPTRLARFFSRHDDTLQINKAVRDMVLFAQHDVVLDPPFTRLDILCCRNLLIYFDASLQRRLLPLFHYSLRPAGIMFLGSAETVGSFNQLFEPIDSALRLYQCIPRVSQASPALLMKSFPPLSTLSKELSLSPPALQAQSPTDITMQSAADRVLLQVHAPPAVVVNADGDIVYISGRTGKYLEPAAGKANWNFHAMVNEQLRQPIAQAIRQASTRSELIVLRGLLMSGPDGEAAPVDVTVQSLHDAPALQGMVMIVFKDVPPVAKRRHRKAVDAIESSQSAEHNAEVQRCDDEIQALREEARTSREKLQAANEELQSTNEELQSANEELTTSKEEMQSMNEELQTVNAEMQAKLDDLSLAQSDMENLLNSTDIAMLFLDQKLNVRRYTERATNIIKLRDSDIGRPLSDLSTSLQYPEMHEDTRETLRTLVFCEKQIQSTDKRWFSVRIMPYRRLDNVIDGAVITFMDITTTKELEARLRQTSSD